MNIDNNFEEEWKAIDEFPNYYVSNKGRVKNGIRCAGAKNGICHQNIGQCCKSPNNTAGGYHWQYVEEEIDNENNAQTSN